MPRPLSYYLLGPLQQWKAGLLDCLPDTLRSRLIPVVEPYVLTLDGHQANLQRQYEGVTKPLGQLDVHDAHVDAGLVSMLANRQAPLLMMLPSSWILRRQITLPAAASENLGQVIQFEMDRLTPFSADQVYYDYRVEQQPATDELIPVNVALVPRNKLETWLSLLTAAGIQLDRISAEGLWSEANFLPQESRSGVNAKQVALKALPLALVSGLLIVAMTLPLWQKRNVAMAMKEKEAPLRKQAHEVAGVRDQLQAEQQRLQLLHTAWTQYPPAIDVLQTLTDILPDDTSLQQMDIKQAQLIMRGTSSQASSLIKLLEESSGFSDVKFMSSVVQQRGKEQFHLSANIVMPFVRSEVVATNDQGEVTAAAKAEMPPLGSTESKPGAVIEPTNQPAPQPINDPAATSAPAVQRISTPSQVYDSRTTADSARSVRMNSGGGR